MAVLAGERRAIATAASKPDRHARGPALRIEVDVMRELEPARFARSVAQRNAHRLRLLQPGEDRGLELRMRRAEIAGIAERGIGKARIARGVAIGAELARKST